MRRREVLAGAALLVPATAGCASSPGDQNTETEGPRQMTPAMETDTPTARETATDTPTATAGTESMLAVSDQQVQGMAVQIDEVAIDSDGWLVIHPEADGGGPKGSVTIAEKQLSGGMHVQDTQVRLSKELAKDQTVYAMLHYDDPMDGEFTFPENGDPPVTNGGSPIVKPMALRVSGKMATVSAKNTAFAPKRLEIDPGTTVEWTNEDSYPHDVTAAQFHNKAESWDFAKQFPAGETVSRTFDSEGIYEYYCTIHGQGTMCGVVLVGDVSLSADLPCESGGNGGGGDYNY